MEKGLLEKTGKSLEHWIKVVKDSKIEKHNEIIKHLKFEHGFSHGFANFVSLKARESDSASMDGNLLIINQYSGKENLRPIYNAIVKEIETFGNDVKIVPKKDSVSIVRKFQFALIKPATKNRIDLGLKIKGQVPVGRLENSGPFGAMCTHRMRLAEVEDIDNEVIKWLKVAYEFSK